MANRPAGVRIDANPNVADGASKVPIAVHTAGPDQKIFGNKAIGPTYNMLRPEVKQCLDKVMY